MTPDHWTERLSEYVDGELDASERAALEAHLAECRECREIAAELRRVTMRASALTDPAPSTDLWPGIAARIGVADTTGVRRVARRPARRRWSFTLPQLAAAGLALAAVGAGGLWVVQTVTDREEPVAVDTTLGGAALVQPAGFPAHARESYDQAVADLQRILAENRSRLDTATVRVLEESLRTIDRALARARAALADDPSDAYLNAHLQETMRRKLDLLRRAAALATASS